MKKSLCVLLLIFILIGTIFTGCIEEEQPPEERNVEEITLEVVEYFNNGKFAEAYALFDKSFQSEVSLETLEDTWNGLTDSFGEIKQIISTRIAVEDIYDVVYVTCNFSFLGKYDLRFVFNQDAYIVGFFIVESAYIYEPPEYVKLGSFTEVNITIGSKEWQLPATITIPNGNGPFSAVILVHGSGPNDRDETIGPNKPFKDLAGGLASQGIAVLRYEKRTREYPEKCASIENYTAQDETIDDAIAAIDALINHKKIDPAGIFIVGHSLGGLLAPRIAIQDNRVAGLVILAGATTKGIEDAYLEQIKYLASQNDGVIDEDEEAVITAAEENVTKVKELNISEGNIVILPYASLAFWKDFAGYNQTQAIKNLSLPILILQGERDYQNTIQDFNASKAALVGQENITFKSYPTLNHLFIAGSGPSTNIEYLKTGHVAEEVIDDVTEWIDNI